MPLHDFRNVRNLNPPIPKPFGVDNHNWAFIAEPHAAASGQLHGIAQASYPYLPVQLVQNSHRSPGCARCDAFRLLLGAYEEMKAERFHDTAPVKDQC